MNTSTISLIAQLDDGSSRPATGEEIIAAAREHMSRRIRRGTQLTSPKATRDYLSLKLGTLEREVFAVIFLHKRHRLISYQEMFQGTIDGASVHPREVVKEALKQNAASVILAHPHPSGVAEPSQADEQITRRLKDALGLVDIGILETSSSPAATRRALPRGGSYEPRSRFTGVLTLNLRPPVAESERI